MLSPGVREVKGKVDNEGTNAIALRVLTVTQFSKSAATYRRIRNTSSAGTDSAKEQE